MSDVLQNPKICKNCGALGCKFKCTCNQGYYCSKECQTKDWKNHKKVCAYKMVRQVKDAKREHGKDDEQVAEERMNAGFAQLGQGRYMNAERHFAEARRIFTEARGAGDYGVGEACHALGATYRKSGKNKEAIGLLEEALVIFRNKEGERSLEAGCCLTEIGNALMIQGQLDEALRRLEEALSICTKAAGSERHGTVADVLTAMGICLKKMGKLDKALEKHKRAFVINRIVKSENVAASLSSIGAVFCEKGMLVEARAKYEEALEIGRRERGEKHPNVAAALSNIAGILRLQGQLDEALEMHSKALKISRRAASALGKDHVDLGMAHNLHNIGFVYHDQGKHAEALEMYGQALAIYDRAFGVDNMDSAGVHYDIAISKQRSGDVAGVLESARESVRIYTTLDINVTASQNAANLLNKLEGSAA